MLDSPCLLILKSSRICKYSLLPSGDGRYQSGRDRYSFRIRKPSGSFPTSTTSGRAKKLTNHMTSKV